MNEINIEIRINPFDDLADCVLCNASSADPDWGASGKANRPELFAADDRTLKWVCIFCARNLVPALADLILVARAAERYGKFFFEGEKSYTSKEIDQFAIRLDMVAKDRPCGVCGCEFVSSSYPPYQPGVPELFVGEEGVCGSCGEQNAPQLEALRELADSSERYAEQILIVPKDKCNGKPAMLAVIDSLGWITCPNCKKRFSSNDKQRYSGDVHRSCGQHLQIINEDI